MLEKSLTTNSDMIIYDLEDSVAPSPADKSSARNRLRDFLKKPGLPTSERIAVRVNGVDTPFFQQDVAEILASPTVDAVVLPKIHSPQDLDYMTRTFYQVSNMRERPLRIISSVESAKGLWNLGGIAGWTSEYGAMLGGTLSALLFAAEDYCADTSIIRTRSPHSELLYTRSQIVTAAKAFGLEAIDMVCISYKDADSLKTECQDGRRLGFSGKQAIHPAQVDIIQSTFVPTSEEILRAAKILHGLEVAHASQKGAVGIEGEMIDAPMLKQAENTVRVAKAAGLEIPLLG